MKQKQFSNVIITLVMLFITSGCSTIWSDKICLPDSDAVYIKLDNLGKNKTIGNCGELAVNQIISYFSKHGTAKKNDLIFSTFNDTISLARYARHNGLKCDIAKPELAQIINDIKNTKPVIVFVPVNSYWFGQYISENYATHCIVICGYQKNKNELLFYSNGEGLFKINAKAFEFEWNKTGRIAIRFEKNENNNKGEN